MNNTNNNVQHSTSATTSNSQNNRRNSIKDSHSLTRVYRWTHIQKWNIIRYIMQNLIIIIMHFLINNINSDLTSVYYIYIYDRNKIINE